MRTAGLMVLLAGMAVAAHGQTVFLKVASSGNKQTQKTTTEGNHRTVHTFRQETVEIAVRNTFTAPLECVVEWMFLAAPAKGGAGEPFEADTKTVSLAVNGTSTIPVTSPQLEARQNYSVTMETYVTPGGGRSKQEKTTYLDTEGVRPAGYVVRVKVNGKIIAVDASDSQLKGKYLNPAAPWATASKPAESETNESRKPPAKKKTKIK